MTVLCYGDDVHVPHEHEGEWEQQPHRHVDQGVDGRETVLGRDWLILWHGVLHVYTEVLLLLVLLRYYCYWYY